MKFVYYNDFSFLDNRFSFYQMLATVFTSFPICRVDEGLNKKYCVLDLTFKPLQFFETDLSIEDVLDSVGNKIIKQKKNMYVCCSGGIDSTCILVSLLKNCNEKITVLFNNHSVEENKGLFELLKSNNRIDFLPCNLKVIDTILEDENNIVLTGTPADIIVEPYIKKEYDNTSYKDYLLHKLFDEFFVLEKYKNKKCLFDFIEHGEHICSFSPIPIFSVKDFWWWIGMSTMYNGLHHIWHCTTSNSRYPINFYDDQLFFDYSINNHIDNKEKMARYNLDYLKDENAVLFYKIKSSKMLDEYEDNLVCINSNYNKILEKHNRYEYSLKKLIHYKKLISMMDK